MEHESAGVVTGVLSVMSSAALADILKPSNRLLVAVCKLSTNGRVQSDAMSISEEEEDADDRLR